MPWIRFDYAFKMQMIYLSLCSLSPKFFSLAMTTLVPGLVFFTIRWWNPATFAAMHPVGTDRTWPYVEDKSYLFTWLFLIPLVVYTLWQVLYFLIVNVLRRQRLLRDPEVMTSYRYHPCCIYLLYFYAQIGLVYTVD